MGVWYSGPDPFNLGPDSDGDSADSGGSDSGGGSGEYDGDSNGVATWGDGSNNWIGGFEDFASDPGQVVREPYDTVAGAADAAALNFDEGVGGLWSLVDDEPGNTAGPGQSPAFSWLPGVERQDGQPANPGTTGSPLVDRGFQLVVGLLLLWVVLSVAAPTSEIAANLSDT